MDPTNYMAMVVSSLCFLMALGALPIAHRESRPRSSIAFGVGFFLVGVGWLLHPARGGPIPLAVVILLQNLCLAAGLIAIWLGAWIRSGQEVSYALAALLAAVWIGACIPFLILRDVPEARFAVAAACIAVGSGSAAWCIWTRKANRNFADKLLAAWFVLVVVLEIWVLGSVSLFHTGATELWRLYGVAMPLLLVGVGVFVFQSYALDSIEDLNRRSETDPLTELLNRRAFDERLRTALASALRYRRPLSLVIADLDHFKRVNDEHGHAAGDAVLREFAGMLRRGSRSVDVVARIGGEEFAIIMPEIGAAHAREYAERLRAETARQLRSEGGAITASFGVAAAADVGYDLHRLAEAADAALYRAKKAGRNRVECHDTQDRLGAFAPPA